MIDTTVPRLIHATIGPKVLSKAAELFDASLATVLNEVLQNSRRAGATAVTISVLPIDDQRCEITIADNGCGITEPEKLLAFGDSGWDLHTDRSENAAGMGCASLGTRGCVVHSRNWKTVLTPASFVGKEDAVILANPPITGTRISWTEQLSATEARAAIERATAFYPIEVTINGQTREKQDFLAGALLVTAFEGVRIGVFPGQFRYGRPLQRLHSSAINFFGLLVHKEPLASLAYANDTTGSSLYAIADVVDCPELKLVLPTRHAVIQNDFLKRLQARSYLALLEYAATTKELLAFKDFSRAKAAGIPIDVGTITLPAWTPQDANRDAVGYLPSATPTASQSLDRAVIIESFEAPIDVDLARAYSETADTQASGPVFFGPNGRLEGYPWYDALPRVMDIAYEASIGEHVQTWDPQGLDVPDLPTIVDHLAIVVKTTTSTLRYDTDILITSVDDDDTPAIVEFIVATAKKPGVSTVVNHVMEAGFQYWEDGDSYDTQKDWAEQEYTERVTAVLLSPRAATMVAIEEAVRKLRYAMKDVTSVLVTDKECVVTFTDGSIEQAR